MRDHHIGQPDVAIDIHRKWKRFQHKVVFSWWIGNWSICIAFSIRTYIQLKLQNDFTLFNQPFKVISAHMFICRRIYFISVLELESWHLELGEIFDKFRWHHVIQERSECHRGTCRDQNGRHWKTLWILPAKKDSVEYCTGSWKFFICRKSNTYWFYTNGAFRKRKYSGKGSGSYMHDKYNCLYKWAESVIHHQFRAA